MRFDTAATAHVRLQMRSTLELAATRKAPAKTRLLNDDDGYRFTTVRAYFLLSFFISSKVDVLRSSVS